MLHACAPLLTTMSFGLMLFVQTVEVRVRTHFERVDNWELEVLYFSLRCVISVSLSLISGNE